jgi:hypothetical protein
MIETLGDILDSWYKCSAGGTHAHAKKHTTFKSLPASLGKLSSCWGYGAIWVILWF